MNSELSKTISISVIWLCVACILTFGVFKMNVSGDALPVLMLFVLPAAMIWGAVAATKIIWLSRGQDQMRADSAGTLRPAPSAPTTVKS
jgi:uncharacterized membrane protein